MIELVSRFAMCALLGLGVAGCAIGNRHDYRVVHLPPPLEGSGTLAIAVHDQRPDVVSGAEDTDYVGQQRAGFGNPFDVTTESGFALSDDWAHVIASAMKRGGFEPSVVRTRPQDTHEQVIGRMHATGARAMLLLMVHRWDADTYNDVTLHHDVVAAVFGHNGALLGHARSTGDSELGGDALDPPAHAEKAVPAAFKRKLEWLLGDPEVTRALTSATRAGAAVAPAAQPPAGFSDANDPEG
jgi:hypothetical protein